MFGGLLRKEIQLETFKVLETLKVLPRLETFKVLETLKVLPYSPLSIHFRRKSNEQ